MNKRCCQYPICFTWDNRLNNETEAEFCTRPFASVSASDFKCVFDRNKTDTAEIYISCKILQKTFHFGVDLSNTIKDVKKHIERLEKIPAVLLHLFFKGVLLGNMNTLEECGVNNKSSLTLGIKLHTAWCEKCKPPCAFTKRELTTVTIKSIIGDTYNIVLPLSNPAETLKELIEKKFKVYPDHQFIMHNGENLEDDVTLEEYGITSLSNLILLVFQYENCSFCAGCAKAAKLPMITLTFFNCAVKCVLYDTQTVKQLKQTSYQYLHHVHPDLQRLTLNDQELDDEKTLDESGLQDGSELVVTLRYDCRKCDLCNGSLYDQ